MSWVDIVMVIFLLIIVILGCIGFFICLCKAVFDGINELHDWEERG